MNHFIAKCSFLLCAVAICFFCGWPALAAAEEIKIISIQEKLAQIEKSTGGQIGVSAINTANNQTIQYRAHERFRTGSTYKVMVVGAVLKESMQNSQIMQQRISYKKEDLISWSPITEQHVATGMTVLELCAAAIMYSDNTATILLIKKLGGAQAVNTFARSLDDQTFKIDSQKLANSDKEDFLITSTPFAMEKSLQQLTLGTVLAPEPREQLVTWMKNNTTGDNRIRAGVPKGWTVADKTGSGDYGLTNDIAIIWPPQCQPIVLSLYFTQNKQDAIRRPDILAQVTRLVLNEFAHTSQCIKIQ